MNIKFLRWLSSVLALLILTACGGGDPDKAGTPLLTLPTKPVQPVHFGPYAVSGSNQNVAEGLAVTLDGSASWSTNGVRLTYSWSLTSTPPNSTAALSDAASARPTFMADAAGVYVATLVVNDGEVNSNASSVTITATIAKWRHCL